MQRQVLLLIALAALGAGCDRGSDTPAEGGTTPGAARESVTITKDMPAHRVEPAPAPCRAGATCTLALRLTSLGQYKVNKDYPFKFVASPTTGVTVENGAFAMDGVHAGVMTVTFRAAAAGSARVAGTFKLSVCSESECRIEEEPVSVDIQVGA
jgi:hypothetical protein